MLLSFFKTARRSQYDSGPDQSSPSPARHQQTDWFRKAPAPSKSNADIQLWNDVGRQLEAQQQEQMQPSRLPLELQMAMTLGACALESRKQAKGQVLQAQAKNRLIALLDSRAMLAHIRPDAYPSDIDDLVTNMLEPQRVFIPPQFVKIPLWDLIWQYGYFEPKAWRKLPLAMVSEPIKLRRLPLVSTSILPSAAMHVIEPMVRGEPCFNQLMLLCRLEAPQIMRCLAALYFTRSIEIVGFKPSITQH